MIEASDEIKEELVAFSMGCDDNADNEVQEGRLIELDGSYYRMNGITD